MAIKFYINGQLLQKILHEDVLIHVKSVRQNQENANVITSIMWISRLEYFCLKFVSTYTWQCRFSFIIYVIDSDDDDDDEGEHNKEEEAWAIVIQHICV